MSPDIHWQIGEDDNQETIAQVSTPRRSRRGWIAIFIVIVLGAGLGMVYRSIPEPVPLTAPAPSPTPQFTLPAIPAKLYQVIDREAQALATGDRRSLRELWSGSEFVQQQRFEQVTAWGTVTNRPLYSILNFGLLSDDSAWAEVSQYRHGSNFRETRFYHLQNGQWRRTGADRRFWKGDEETADTLHFHVIYAVEDRELVTRMLNQLEQDYAQICADFECPTISRQCVEFLGQQWCSEYAHEYTLTLQLNGDSVNPAFHDQTLELPSPRVLGLYESGQPIHYDSETVVMAIVPLAQIWALAYDTPLFASIPSPLVNQPLVIALTLRELEHLQIQRGVPAPRWETLLLDGQSSTTGSPQLKSLWTGPASQQRSTIRALDAYRFIQFLEQEFGQAALVKLLHNMQEPSPVKAFEASTGVPFNQLERRWAAWLKSHTP